VNPPNPQTVLVIAEHDDGQLKLASLAAVACARQVCADTGGRFDVLVLGDKIEAIAESVRGYGAANVLAGDDPAIEHPLADKFAAVIAGLAKERGVSMIVATASTFSKDVLPRVAALLDAGMLSDVTAVAPDAGDFTFQRVMFAGNAIATVKLSGPVKVFTVRAAAFTAPPQAEPGSPVVALAVDAASLPNHAEFLSREERASGRPDPTEARIVVSGGRAFKNAEDFERLVGGLADALGGAVGSSRALVDSGITPNSLQIGQTGKVVAPELYIALGISGAIQHLAGMKDTKTVVAINQDSDAPIFEVADYGLVGDVYQIVPELIQKLKQA
jgi:electron transfer flavoprotein alpha subunit